MCECMSACIKLASACSQLIKYSCSQTLHARWNCRHFHQTEPRDKFSIFNFVLYFFKFKFLTKFYVNMSGNGGDDWCLIESDPGVFTELIRGFGCVGAQVEEMWSLDTDSFRCLEPIHGLIFLFKWVDEEPEPGRLVTDSGDIFFAKQVVTNACATQAIISLLLNLEHEDIELGETLTNLKQVCRNYDPAMRGMVLGNTPQIRKVHNSFARPMIGEVNTKPEKHDDDAYHFVGYMPIGGRLYELDGLQQGPIDWGEIGAVRSWLDVVKPIIEARMQRYSSGEIHFNLMALVSDRQRLYERQIECMQKPSFLLDALMSEPEREAEIAFLRPYLEHEKEKNRRYHRENVRRRHNYLPFILELLKQLGEIGQLVPIYEQAKARALELQERGTKPDGHDDSS